MTKIRYKSGSTSPFFRSLDKEVNYLIANTDILTRARRKLWMKMIVYFGVHVIAYILLFVLQHQTIISLALNYVFIGLSGLFLGFNVSHDALHDTFSKNKKVNYWIYQLSFNIQGNNAYLWKIRHRSSHHVFPNVDGCDADIDDNPFIRLSPQHPLRKHQRYQHWYSFLVYAFYTLHWFLFKDALYLFKKKVANLQQKEHSPKEHVLFFVWKILYLFLILGIPLLLGYSPGEIFLCFFIMHVVNSLAFIHFLIATHFCMETQFPEQDEQGFLPYDYYTHQLATSMDYAPGSRYVNFFLGGFNAHAAHHLYPKLPHTIYPELATLIEEKAREYHMPYNKLSWGEAIRSHYRYLKMMGRSSNKKCKAASCKTCSVCIK